MPSDETYNGWRNYETWNVHLWLSNDESSYNDVRQVIADRLASDMETDDRILADLVREYVGDTIGLGGYGDAITGMAGDLIGHALSRVDWSAIVAAFRE